MNIKEWQCVDRKTFEQDIIPSGQPAVIRDLAADWRCIETSQQSAADLCRNLAEMDIGVPVYTIAASPDAGGRFFYSNNLKGLNFRRGQVPLPQVLDQLVAQSDDPDAHSIAVQSLPVREVLPDFEERKRPAIS